MRTWVDLTIGAGEVASTLTNFVVRVQLSDMPASWWANVAAGGSDIRVKASGVELPIDLVSINVPLGAGELFFKSTLTTGSQTFQVETGTGAAAPAVTDPTGRNAVWADYDFVMDTDYTVNRTGSAVTISANGTPFPWVADQIYNLGLAGNAQGITSDPSGAIYVSSDATVRKYNDSLALQVSNTNALNDVKTATGDSTLNHMDGCVVHGGELFVGVSEYPRSGGAGEYVAVFNTTTLALDRTYDVSSTGHQLSGIGSDGTYFYSVGYDVGTNVGTTVQKWNSDWTHNATITTPSLTQKQGITHIGGGQFYIVTFAGSAVGVHLFTYSGTTGTLNQIHGTFTNGVEESACVLPGGDLLLLDEDWVVFRYNPAGDWLAGGAYYAKKAVGVPKRTQWTMGCSIWQGFPEAESRGYFSYAADGGTDSNRETMAIRGTVSPRRYGAWNSTDGWLSDTTIAGEFGLQIRLSHTFNGTTNREIFINGATKGVDTGTSQRPGSTGDTLFLLDSDTTYAEGAKGGARRFYLRNGVLSADWLAAEYVSWETPQSFYTIGATVFMELGTIESESTVYELAVPLGLGTIESETTVFPLSYVEVIAPPPTAPRRQSTIATPVQIKVNGTWLASIGWWGDPKISDRWPLGCWQVSWEMNLAPNQRPPALKRGALVEVYYGTLCVWAGTLTEPDWDSSQFVAQGACREAEGALALDAGATTSVPDAAIDDAISRGALTWTRPDSLSAVAFGEAAETDRVNRISALLDAWATSEDLRWAVGPDRRVYAAPDPTVPMWHVMPDSGALGVADDDYYTHVYGRHQALDGTWQTVTASDESQGAGRRELPVDLSQRGRIDTAAAQAAVDGILAKTKARTGWTNGIRVPASRITTPGGVQANLAQIKAGQMVRLLGLTDPRGLTAHIDIILGEQIWDPVAKEITLNPVGMVGDDFASTLEQAISEAGGVLS